MFFNTKRTYVVDRNFVPIHDWSPEFYAHFSIYIVNWEYMETDCISNYELPSTG